jgi:hypothetical protein
VEQSVDAAEVHEGAVVGEILDDAFQRRAFLQAIEQGIAFRAVLFFDDCAPTRRRCCASDRA